MSAPRLSDETKDAIVRDYLAGINVYAIAAQYGVGHSYPGILARRRGHQARRPYRSEADKDAILQDYLGGVPVKIIAYRHATNPSYIRKLAVQSGHPIRRQRRNEATAA